MNSRKITALYERLSREDTHSGDSDSIAHQKAYLEQVAAARGFENCRHYTDDGWSGGSNIAMLKAIAQKLVGAIKVGSDSSLTLELTDGSTFEGSIDGSIVNAKGETVSTEVGAVSVTLDATSTWTLTGDSYVTEFNGDAANVVSNGYTLYVNGTALTGTK